MNFLCLNADDMSGILTKGRTYKGEYAKHLNLVKIFRCDDKKYGYFDGYRFEEVVDTVLSEPEVRIYNYFVEVEKR